MSNFGLGMAAGMALATGHWVVCFILVILAVVENK